MEATRCVVVKLGGSVITRKDSPLTPNPDTMRRLGNALAKVMAPLAIVHGGGSFGHHYASQYGLSRKEREVQAEGVSKTRLSMLNLNLMVLDNLAKGGLNPYQFPAGTFMEGRKPTPSKLAVMKSLLARGLTPVSFGDVLLSDNGFFVISGDEIMKIFCEYLKPSRAVFAMDVDGILESVDPPGRLLSTIDPATASSLTLSLHKGDVTGGVKLKLEEAFDIARRGCDVCFVNGLKPERVLKALLGEPFEGTIVKGEEV